MCVEVALKKKLGPVQLHGYSLGRWLLSPSEVPEIGSGSASFFLLAVDTAVGKVSAKEAESPHFKC